MSLRLNRRQLLTLSGLGAGTLALAACGGPDTSGGDGTTTGGTDSDTGDGVDWGSIEPASTIEFWSNHPGGSQGISEELIAEFNDSGAGITVNLVTAGSNYEEVAQRFQTQQAAGQLPDLVVLSDVWWFRYYMQGSILPLDGVAAAAGIDSGTYVDALWGDYLYDGQQWAVPYARSTPLFYYNKEHWAAAGLEDRAPETWEEFAEWAPELQAANPGIQTAYQFPALAGYAGWTLQNLLWGFGGGWSAPDSFDITADSAESIAAMQFAQDSVRGGTPWAGVSSDDQIVDLAAGAVSATIGSTGQLVGAIETASFELGVGFLPGGPVEQRPVCPTGGAGLGIPAEIDPERQLAAAIFLEWYTNAENAVRFAAATGYMPVRTDADTSELTSTNPLAQIAIDQLAETRSQDFARVFIPGADQEMANTTAAILNEGADVTESLTSLAGTLETMYEREVVPNI